MNKINKREKLNQVHSENFQPKEFVIGPLWESFLEDPESHLEQMNDRTIGTLNTFIKLYIDNGYKPFQISNNELIQMIEGQSTSLCRSKKLFLEYGFINIYAVKVPFQAERGMGKAQEANYYTVNPKLYLPAMRTLLETLLPALKFLSLALLMVTGSLFSNEKVYSWKYGEHINKAIRINNNFNRAGDILGEVKMKNGDVRDQSLADEVIPERVKAIRVIQLTHNGMIRLSCFPAPAIEWAEKKMVERKKFIVDVFAYFVQLCHEYCQLYDIQPDYERLNIIKQVFGYRDDLQMVKANVVFRKKALVTPPQSLVGADPNTHPGVAPIRSAYKKRYSPTSSSQFPQTGRLTDSTQAVASLVYGIKNKISLNSNAGERNKTGAGKQSYYNQNSEPRGSLSRQESPMVQASQRCAIASPYKEWKPAEDKGHHYVDRDPVKPILDPNNEFAKMLGLV